MEKSMRSIVSTHFRAFSRAHAVPRHVHRAARQLSRCRTGQLGAHVQQCPAGHFMRIVHHSCHHRWCPQCNAVPTQRWLEKIRARLIDCAHHHIIFTVPHELLGLWRYNRAWFTQRLFGAVADTLRQLCADARYLDAEPAYLLALHTWGRSLQLHPHIHALISDGGLTAAGQWQQPKKSCFLPARVVMSLFRGKLLSALRGELEALELPPQEAREKLTQTLDRLQRAKWNVFVCRRYAHGQGVMTYLARYVRGGPLKNTQLLDTGATITYRYHSHGEGGGARRMTLSPDAFLDRYLQHTPLPVTPVIRYYGLYATCRGQALDQARAAHGQCPREELPVRALTATEYWLQRAGAATSATHCPRCGVALVRIDLPAPRGPP